MDLDGLNCYPSKATLANRMGCSERTVARMLNELKAAGWLAWRQRPKRGTAQMNSNVYIPMIPDGKEVDSRTKDNLSDEMSWDSTGGILEHTSTYSDISEEGALVIDATCVYLRNHYELDAAHTDGYLKYVDAVQSTYLRHGKEGLLRLCEQILNQSRESLHNTISPLRVLAYRINTINNEMPIIDPALPFD
jgi:hypothetical protein